MSRWAPSAHRGSDLARVEAPVTLRGYLLCVFAAFGGILFGYDSGYISGVLAMSFFKHEFGGMDYQIRSSHIMLTPRKVTVATSLPGRSR